MSFLFDLALVAVIVLFAFIGKKRGFIKSFFSFFGSLISFFLSTLLAHPVGDFLAEKLISPALERIFVSRLSEAVGGASNVDFSDLSEAGRQVLSTFGISADEAASFVAAKADEVGESAVDALAAHVVAPISEAVGFALAFVLLFVIFSVVIRILVSVLNLIAKLPFLNFSNRTLGLLVGAVEGLFIAVLLSELLFLSEPYLQGSDMPVLSGISLTETYLARFLSGLGIFGQIS